LALGYGRLCQALTKQSIDVVFATVSFFEEVWQWNRENIPAYHETYLKVDRETLFERDQKGLYSAATNGETSNVVGVDLILPEPSAPHLVLPNNGERSPEDVAADIFDFFGAGK
jgi:adenylylsulfate kinase